MFTPDRYGYSYVDFNRTKVRSWTLALGNSIQRDDVRKFLRRLCERFCRPDGTKVKSGTFCQLEASAAVEGIVRRSHIAILVLSAASLLLAGCGGGVSNTSLTPILVPSSTAQGLYIGTAKSGSTTLAFEGLVLPNDQFYAAYGIASNGTDGVMTGQGDSAKGAFTVTNLTDYYNTGQKFTDSITGSYVAGASLSGVITENGGTIQFSGTTPPLTTFNFNTPAVMSSVAGKWSGAAMLTYIPSVDIGSNGAFSGGWSGGEFEGCSYSGQLTPDATKNFFTVTVGFKAATSEGCYLADQTLTGVAVTTTADTGLVQLLVAVSNPSYATVFIGSR